MNKHQILVEAKFKNAAKRAIFSLLFFGFSYAFLLLLSVIFGILCCLGGVALMSLKVNAITLGLGIGLIALGIIIFVFLIKFIFKKNTVDRSHLVELEESDSPMLYDAIRDIVNKAQTSFPKKIYLSHDVNAAVFYDSTFLSMFLPIKKNLQIGMGLINSVSAQELKSILAHEFGHFSQKSMKVGSYVYSVNQIIYNLLYENNNYSRTIETLAEISSYLAIFIGIGNKIITGIQWILRKLYNIVNLNHLGLSREMEFHADAIAASIIGPNVFISSLLRLDLANNSYDQVLTYYENKIIENIKPNNVYPQQFFVMNLTAKETNIQMVHNFPQVTEGNFNRYNKSKLVIKDQWASHPSIEDRILAIKKYNFEDREDDGMPATNLFVNIEELQQMVTDVLFSKVEYKGKTTADSFSMFEEGFLKNRKIANFPKMFNGYYDHNNPVKVDLENSIISSVSLEFDSLFSAERVDLIYVVSSMQNDIAILKQLQNESVSIKSFEYDGVKYRIDDIPEILENIEHILKELQAKIALNDLEIYHYFKQKATEKDRLKEKYQNYIEFDKIYDAGYDLYGRAMEETQFVQVTTPFSQIEANFKNFTKTEEEIKKYISELLKLKHCQIPENSLIVLNSYLTTDLIYFTHPNYNDAALESLYTLLNTIRESLNENYFLVKSTLLEEFETLQQKVTPLKNDTQIV